MPELKPCPFCGGKVELKDYTANVYGFRDYEIRCKCGMRFRSGSTSELYWVGKTYHTPQTDRQKKIAYDNMIVDYNRRQTMSDNDIVKALECCTSSTTSEACNGCPLFSTTICTEMENGLQIYALDLINRQKAEIEKLEVELKAMRGAANSYKAENERLQRYIHRCESGEEYWVKCLLEKPVEAVEEFAAMLKEEARTEFDSDGWVVGECVDVREIDNLVEKMKERKQDAMQDTAESEEPG